MQRSTLARRAWRFLFLAAALFYLHGLGRLPLLGPDEPRYAQVAREMFTRHDLVTPTLGDHTWFEKPALLYWMMIASFTAFGVSEWAARLGPALSGLICAVVIYWLGRRVERAAGDETAGGLALWGGAALLSSPGMIGFSYGASFDIVITMTITAALACFFVSELEDDWLTRRRLLIGFYASVGASLLAKGLVGIVIPFGVVATYYVLRRSRPERRIIYSVAWGVPLALVVASLWYGPVIFRHGWTFVDEFFVQHHIARYVSNKYHHPQPFYFYLPVMALLALPWTPFLVAAVVRMRDWTWRAPDPVSKFQVFASAWLLVPLVFFSVSGSKLPGYVLPALPGAMLLVGGQLAAFVREEEGPRGAWAMRATASLLLLSSIGGTIYATQTGITTISCALAVAAPLLAAGAFALIRTRERTLCLVLMICATFAALALALTCAAQDVARRESVRDLIRSASARGYASATVLQLHTIEHTAEFYAAGRLARAPGGELTKFEGSSQVADVSRRNGGPVLVLVPLEHVGQLTGDDRMETEVIGDNGAIALVAVRAR